MKNGTARAHERGNRAVSRATREAAETKLGAEKEKKKKKKQK